MHGAAFCSLKILSRLAHAAPADEQCSILYASPYALLPPPPPVNCIPCTHPTATGLADEQCSTKHQADLLEGAIACMCAESVPTSSTSVAQLLLGLLMQSIRRC